MNLLATTIQMMPDFSMGLDFLGEFARVIIEGVGILGLGIIVFTLVLKGITLPFDIYQRYKMRKQTLIMKEMKEDLEKLQKQYANDQTAYNMKMQELYKKNGYSVFGACLPMLISLIILIVAFQGFNSYSRYATVQLFVNMKDAYNQAVFSHSVGGVEGGTDYLIGEDENSIPLADINETGVEKVFKTDENGLTYTIRYEEVTVAVFDADGLPVIGDGGAVTESLPTPFLYVEKAESAGDTFIYYKYRLGAYLVTRQAGGETKKELVPEEEARRIYVLDDARMDAFLGASSGDFEKETAEKLQAAETESGKSQIRLDYLVHVGATAAAEWYTPEHDAHFLWIKNVWYPDASFRNPVPKETVSPDLSQELYDNLTSELEEEKSAANGYYILIILSIAAMALSQFITMRSQKESNQYQTVDGQGAATQKVMLVMMPLIYAVFAFLYSAAFSIYMIVSSLISLLVTVICNLILGRIFRKKEEEAIRKQYGREIPWKKPDQNGKAGKNGKKGK